MDLTARGVSSAWQVSRSGASRISWRVPVAGRQVILQSVLNRFHARVFGLVVSPQGLNSGVNR